MCGITHMIPSIATSQVPRCDDVYAHFLFSALDLLNVEKVALHFLLCLAALQ